MTTTVVPGATLVETAADSGAEVTVEEADVVADESLLELESGS